MPISDQDLQRWFGYHPAGDEQKKAYKQIEDKSRELAALMVKLCPESADTTAAVRKLREAKMTAVASIACANVKL